MVAPGELDLIGAAPGQPQFFRSVFGISPEVSQGQGAVLLALDQADIRRQEGLGRVVDRRDRDGYLGGVGKAEMVGDHKGDLLLAVPVGRRDQTGDKRRSLDDYVQPGRGVGLYLELVGRRVRIADVQRKLVHRVFGQRDRVQGSRQGGRGIDEHIHRVRHGLAVGVGGPQDQPLPG